jgi:hypothetical protein
MMQAAEGVTEALKDARRGSAGELRGAGLGHSATYSASQTCLAAERALALLRETSEAEGGARSFNKRLGNSR